MWTLPLLKRFYTWCRQLLCTRRKSYQPIRDANKVRKVLGQVKNLTTLWVPPNLLPPLLIFHFFFLFLIIFLFLLLLSIIIMEEEVNISPRKKQTKWPKKVKKVLWQVKNLTFLMSIVYLLLQVHFLAAASSNESSTIWTIPVVLLAKNNCLL